MFHLLPLSLSQDENFGMLLFGDRGYIPVCILAAWSSQIVTVLGRVSDSFYVKIQGGSLKKVVAWGQALWHRKKAAAKIQFKNIHANIPDKMGPGRPVGILFPRG